MSNCPSCVVPVLVIARPQPDQSKRTDTLVHGVHAHVLVQLSCGVLAAPAELRRGIGSHGLLHIVDVFHPFLQFRGCQIGVWKSDDYYGAGKIVGEVQPF